MGAWVYNHSTGDEYYDEDAYSEADYDKEWAEIYNPWDEHHRWLDEVRLYRHAMYILRWNPGRSKRGNHGEASADANDIPF